MIDVDFTTPEGKTKRIRKVSPVATRRGAEDYERQVRNALLDGSYVKGTEEATTTPVPTLSEFFQKFVDGHGKAEKLKHGTLLEYQSIYKTHLLPRFGNRRLNDFTVQDIARLKLDFSEKSGKTLNNVLTVLSRCLRVAAEWQVIEQVPCTIKLVRNRSGDFQFYDFEQFAELVAGARGTGDPRILALVLLGGQAGLRDGEIQELEWGDVDMKRGIITVQRNFYRGVIDVPKGGRLRRVEMTEWVQEALGALPRRLHSRKVLLRDDGTTVSHAVLKQWMTAAQQAAGMTANGLLHVLRHTFCSHLAMKAVPVKAIQELAGHANLTTTQRYMHLSPAEKGRAIATLNAVLVRPANGTWTAQGNSTEVNSASARGE